MLQKNSHQLRHKALLLVTPLLLFLLVFFILPIVFMLYKGIHDPTLVELLPKTTHALTSWQYHKPYKKTPLPDEKIYEIFSLELQQLAKVRLSGKLAEALNRIVPQSGSMVKKTTRKLKNSHLPAGQTYQALLTNIDPAWANIKIWSGIKNTSSQWTIAHYANALDYEITPSNQIKKRSAQYQIYLPTLGNTLWVALIITLLCIILGYPVAYYITTLPQKEANVALLFVLLPFWTAFLVRTTAWIALLQTEGIINKTLMLMQIIDRPLDLLYNQFAMVIAMVHILLPFMILPLYSVMKSIDPSYLKASYSLGGNAFISFIKVYLPLSAPGLAAGCLLVFIISLGYYITPALLGGIDGQLMSNLIALHMRETNNWALASALSGVLLLVVSLLYIIYDKKVGLKSLKF